MSNSTSGFMLSFNVKQFKSYNVLLFIKTLFIFLLFATVSEAQTQVYRPSENFSTSGQLGNNTGLNGYDGQDPANTDDDFLFSSASAACLSGDQITFTLSVDGTGSCPGSFRTATIDINNTSGADISNALLNLTLTPDSNVAPNEDDNAFFNGEPYNLTNISIRQPNIFDPNYPAVPNAISGNTGLQTLEIINLPNGSSSFQFDYVLGASDTTIDVEIADLSTTLNASGNVVDSNTQSVTPSPVITAGTFSPSTFTSASTTVTFSSYSVSTGTIAWSSGTDGAFNNANTANPVYSITDQDIANGFMEFSITADNSGCTVSETLRIPIDNVLYDYGDAPTSYDFGEDTVPVAAGSTLNPDIYLGSTAPSDELAAQPTTNATGDGAEEDGLHPIAVGNVFAGDTFTITVDATNDSAENAFLRAYIDWNNDGDFLGDEGEQSALVNVPASSGLASYAVDFTVPTGAIFTDETIIRLRLSTDEFAARRTFGASANGEVEDFQVERSPALNLRVYLAGALINNGGATGSNSEPLMRDDLRSNTLATGTPTRYIPDEEPYTALAGFTHVGNGGGEVAKATAFDDRGQDSVVDWVFIEYRDSADNTVVLETQSAFVQRDGDVVDVDGVSPIRVPGATSTYFVTVRHRNHLGVMTAAAEDLRADPTVDFSDNNAGGSGVFNYGTSHPAPGASSFDFTGLSQQTTFAGTALPGGVSAMWFGNPVNNDKIKYTSPGDDNFRLFSNIILFPGNSTGASNFDLGFGYGEGDLDMNGKIKYTSPNDDTFFIFQQVLLYPLNTNGVSNFDFFLEQIPQ